MKYVSASDHGILLTGATGFIGSEVLQRLLDAGHSPVVLVRGESGEHAAERLSRALEAVRPGDFGRVSRCHVLAADLRQQLLGLSKTEVEKLAETVDTVISVAACTSFDSRPDGEPWATNVEGLGRLTDFALQAGAAVHHFSTAFVCGDRPGCWPESPAEPGEHHNAYEASKWAGEQLLRDAASRGLTSLTVYRPSITISDRAGQALPGEHGISVLVNSLRTAARLVGRRQGGGHGQQVDLRQLRVDAGPQNPVHLAPVGWVSDVFLHIFSDPSLHERTYHLALSEPPTVDQLRQALESCLNIDLGPYTDEDLWNGESCSGILETRFYRLAHSLRHYFRQSMSFSTENLDEALSGSPLAGLRFREEWWPTIFESTATRPERVTGKRKTQNRDPGIECRDYFERWLPDRAPRSELTRLTSLTVDVGFWIRGAGRWTLRFRSGQLEDVERTASAARVRTGFRTGLDTFQDVVSGKLAPQQAFLTGRAEIVGDVEAGLKFAMILQQFVREFPWTPGGTDTEKRSEAGR